MATTFSTASPSRGPALARLACSPPASPSPSPSASAAASVPKETPVICVIRSNSPAQPPAWLRRKPNLSARDSLPSRPAAHLGVLLLLLALVEPLELGLEHGVLLVELAQRHLQRGRLAELHLPLHLALVLDPLRLTQGGGSG